MMLARVVGAGLSGLTAAWRLTEAGCTVEVIEAAAAAGRADRNHRDAARPGGRRGERIRLEPVGRQPLCLARHHTSIRVGARRAAVHLPRRPPAPVASQLSRDPDAGAARCGDSRDRTIGAGWTRKRPRMGRPGMGPCRDAVAHLACAARSLCGVRGGARRGCDRGESIVPWPLADRDRRIAAPRGGMSELMNRLVDRLRQRGTTFTFGSSLESLDPSIPTVVATSARAAAPLVAPHAPRLGAALACIADDDARHWSTAFFPPHDDDLHGFGVLFPRGCGVEALGVRFDSDVFPGRRHGEVADRRRGSLGWTNRASRSRQQPALRGPPQPIGIF